MASTTIMANFDMEQILSARIDLTQREKTTLKEALDHIDGKIKVGIATVGQRPREKEHEIVATMKALERAHSTTSQTSATDRQFMRDHEKLRQKKKVVDEYTVSQAALDELKGRRMEIQKELREKDRTLEELQIGVRKLRIASRLKCSTSDIIEQRFVVPESKMAHVIGKGGSNLRLVESEYNVSIDTERSGGGLRIIGTESSIAAAHGSILTIVNQSSEEIIAPDATLVCLMLNKAALAHEIQTRCNVRLDVSRAKKVCKVIGLQDDTVRALGEIKAIDSAHEEIPIDSHALPFIVGKGGAAIRALGETYRVIIDIVREEKPQGKGEGEEARIIVMGFRDDVRKAAATLRGMIDENIEVDETISVDRQVLLGCVVGNGGVTIRNLQRDLDVQMKLDKSEAGNNIEVLTIHGTTGKVLAAKVHVQRLLDCYVKNTDTIPITEEVLPLIVGKKGARIKSIRDAHPSAVIDLNESSVSIHSNDPAVRQSARNAINEVIANNFVKNLKVSAHIANLLKGYKGIALRDQLTNELSVSVSIDPEEGLVKLRGAKGQVERSIEMIEAFEASNVTAFVTVSDEDCSTLLAGGDDAPFNAIETKFDVEIVVTKKDRSVRIRGPEDAVDEAKTALLGLLKGDISHGSCLINIDQAAFSRIIGKGGGTLRRLEGDYNVKIDLLKSVDQVRLRGDAENIVRAKKGLVEFLADVRVTSKVDLPKAIVTDIAASSAVSSAAGIPGLSVSVAAIKLEKIINTVISLYHVEIIRGANQLTIKGHLNLVEEAKKHLKDHLEGKSVCKLAILPHQVVPILSAETSFHLIERKHHVKIDIKADDIDKASIDIEGPTSPVGNAKIELFRFLDTMFPSEFASVAMNSSCLRVIGSPRSLSDIQEKAGGNVVLTVDRPLSCIRIRGDAHAVSTAVAAIKEELSAWKDHHTNVDVDEFMLSSIVGKNGSAIMKLQKDMGVSVHVNRDLMRVEVSGEDKDAVAETTRRLSEKVDRLRSGYWEILLETELVGLVIGKQGANIKKLRADTGATIDLDPKSTVLKVSGEPDKVQSARELIEAFLRQQRTLNYSISIKVPPAAFPFIIGAKGAVAQEIQQSSGAKFDLDRNQNLAIIKGSSEACSKAADAITEILEREGFGANNAPTKTTTSAVTSASASLAGPADEESVDERSQITATSGSVDMIAAGASKTTLSSFSKIPPGASPELIAQLDLQEKTANMSKSAARRHRRKTQPALPPLPPSQQQQQPQQQQQLLDQAEGDDDDDDDDDDGHVVQQPGARAAEDDRLDSSSSLSLSSSFVPPPPASSSSPLSTSSPASLPSSSIVIFSTVGEKDKEEVEEVTIVPQRHDPPPHPDPSAAAPEESTTLLPQPSSSTAGPPGSRNSKRDVSTSSDAAANSTTSSNSLSRSAADVAAATASPKQSSEPIAAGTTLTAGTKQQHHHVDHQQQQEQPVSSLLNMLLGVPATATTTAVSVSAAPSLEQELSQGSTTRISPPPPSSATAAAAPPGFISSNSSNTSPTNASSSVSAAGVLLPKNSLVQGISSSSMPAVAAAVTATNSSSSSTSNANGSYYKSRSGFSVRL